jgi:hypothetical protein
VTTSRNPGLPYLEWLDERKEEWRFSSSQKSLVETYPIDPLL